ncbi:glycerophosphodiester phosphodiesterase [Flavobacterium lacustre]|uniref:glycerophosphodiester phosphodiesterase n=1 Tax=Flavobacterium lacustre TaxID=3016339 RepID=UPI0022B7345D|nr:glycerophosphodiester phosphodiesterase family protein [Flavobacterium lacustre]
MLKIGHRGAKGYASENSLFSFEKAIEMGVDGIELDVHLSLDGQIIVIHDDTIDRTTNGKGFVNTLSLQELKTFRINEKQASELEQQIPTLNEVFDLVNQTCFINIELKGKGTASAVVALIEKYIWEKNWKYANFLISSFDWNAVQEVRFLNENIPIGILTETNLDLAFSFAKFMKAEAIHPEFHLLTQDNTAQIQAKGIQVFPWTVNEYEAIQKIKTYNVNAIITDFPDRI